MPFTPLVFTGISTYSDDFNTVLKRAVSIATLPLTALQNQDADILSQKTALASLNASVGSLASSLTALGTLSQNKALTATSSDSTKVSVVASGATSPASYTISEITSVASAASEVSATGYADAAASPVSTHGTTPGTFKLYVGDQSYTFTLDAAHNNLTGLRDKINTYAGVNASVLTTGTGVTPNYLSLTADASGASTLRLVDDPDGAAVDLLTSAHQGTNANFKLNGVPISKPTNVVNDVVSGATFTIQGITDPTDTTQSVTLSLQSDRSQLQSALQSFAMQYNSLVDAVVGQVGPSGGVLRGNNIVNQIQDDLRQLTSYAGTGSVKSLSDLGLNLGDDGKITFDTTAFAALSDTQISSGFDFLGSTTTGLSAFANSFTQISDPLTGLAKLQQDNYDASDKRLQSSIADLNDRITDLQTSVTARLQAADALQAELDSQQSILTATLTALDTVTNGKRAN